MNADRFVAVVVVSLLVIGAVFMTLHPMRASETTCQEITIEAPAVTAPPSPPLVPVETPVPGGSGG